MVSSLRKAIPAIGMSLVLVMGTSMFMAPKAYADDSIAQLTQTVEQTAKQYDDAVSNVQQIEQRITDNQGKIDALQQQINEQKQASNEALKTLYIYQRSTPRLMNLVLSSEDMSSMFGTLDYLNRVEQYNMGVIQSQINAKEELEAAQQQLNSDKEQAVVAQQNAAAALQQAKDARQAAMDRAAQEAAQELVQEQQGTETKSTAANSASMAAAATQTTQTHSSVSGNTQKQQVTSTVESNSVNWESDKQQFVNSWASRIDAYLAGSPLAGQGRTFAEAAWEYGVDPRWSPAIATVESGKGSNCSKSYNAWGWGNSGFSNWNSAIWTHVSGLARCYGSTLTLSAAKKYCPPNYSYWYNRVLAEMNSI